MKLFHAFLQVSTDGSSSLPSASHGDLSVSSEDTSHMELFSCSVVSDSL